jgi:hypothetical protein
VPVSLLAQESKKSYIIVIVIIVIVIIVIFRNKIFQGFSFPQKSFI